MSDEQLLGSSITEIVKKRISVRTYLEQPLKPEIQDTLRGFFSTSRGPFGGNVRFELIESDLARKESSVKLGTYGVIKGASTYVVAVVEKADRNLEDFGYSFEKVVLYATSLGLGTCWLGGTFKKSEFAKAIEQKDHEILPCISPIGYPSNRKSLIDSAMRFTAGSKNRKGWGELFFNSDFGHHLSKSAAGKYETPLEMLRLAPSASNKQPWRIVKDTNKSHFFLQHTKGYAKFMAHDLQRVDMGIAMCHFELTAKEQGISGKWQISDIGSISTPPDTEYLVSWVEGI
ncbi:nitroreductase family protein [Desulfosporosinus nitroreducens]|uniref:nitroreductase family protein n=1 Tax=Desulfosporosinus nitroreducens TaxID=2018668 RepID=UPI00207C7A4C|nr:nitroreductase family protein [Desulfosporosinus nitroreducens]MCO1603504.1 nitroreductase family protein [Desulfosporosinus nitroreducens]